MRLYGTDTCNACTIAKKLLTDKGYGYYEWVDVKHIQGFSGEIPQLELDDGTMIVSLGQINNWVKLQQRIM